MKKSNTLMIAADPYSGVKRVPFKVGIQAYN